MRRRTAGLVVALCLTIPIAGATAAAAAPSGPAPGLAVAAEHAGSVAKGKHFQVVTPPVTDPAPEVIMAQ